MKYLVIFRSGKRGQIKELEQIDRQFTLDDIDVMHDRLASIAGESEDVTAVGHDPGLFPCEQHLSIIRDLVLAFLSSEQIVRVDILQTDIRALYAGSLTLWDEVLDLVAEGVDLDDEADVQLLDLAKLDQTVENNFPILIAREVVVGDKKRVKPLSEVHADDLLDVVRRPSPRLAALDIDDRAERAREGTSSSGVEACSRSGRQIHAFGRQQRRRDSLEIREIVHEVVHGRKLIVVSIL